MKKLLLPLLILLSPALLHAQQSYFRFEAGQTSELLADNVNVRSGPDKNESVRATLPIGTSVEVLELGDAGTEIKGIQAPWIKVRFEQDGKSQEGYLWSGLLATASFTSKKDPSVKFYFGPDHVGEADWGPQVYLQVRAVKNGRQIAKLAFEAVGDMAPGAYWEAMDGQGIEGVHDIFDFGFAAGYCAGPAGDVYIFWDGKSFYKVKTIYSGSDAPVFQDEVLIFPKSEGGRPDRIIWSHIAGEYLDNGGEEIEEQWEETYLWNGKKLVKISR